MNRISDGSLQSLSIVIITQNIEQICKNAIISIDKLKIIENIYIEHMRITMKITHVSEELKSDDFMEFIIQISEPMIETESKLFSCENLLRSTFFWVIL